MKKMPKLKHQQKNKLSRRNPTFYVIISCRKKELIQMNENKTNINWLACIYGDHHLNPYKMVHFSKWNLASFNKKRRKIWEK